MPVITVTGLIGSGAFEVGADVAKKLGIDYIDRMILAEAAKKIGTTVAAVAERTERPPRLGDRVAGFVKTVLERSALAGGGADPYFGGGLDALLVREYRDFPTEEAASDETLSDENLLKVTSGVIQEIAASGDVVIAGRGANVILHDMPGALHVGLVSRHAERVGAHHGTGASERDRGGAPHHGERPRAPRPLPALSSTSTRKTRSITIWW